MIPLSFIAACAPANVAPQTIAAIIKVESGGDPLVLHINAGADGVLIHPTGLANALSIVRRATSAGASVDIGLMQVNTANVGKLGYTIAQMFDPCTNIKAGAMVLSADYSGALGVAPAGQKALQAALSAYNTGNYHSGFINGYVAHYYGAAAGTAAASPNPLTAGTTVFRRSSQDARFGSETPIAVPGHWPGQGG